MMTMINYSEAICTVMDVTGLLAQPCFCLFNAKIYEEMKVIRNFMTAVLKNLSSLML
jgi:hypothetical protein